MKRKKLQFANGDIEIVWITDDTGEIFHDKEPGSGLLHLLETDRPFTLTDI